MNTSKKCRQCGLVNFATDDLCRRCSADLNAPAPLSVLSPAPKSKSNLYVGLFVLFLVGFGIWGYWYKTGSDRELAVKAEFMRHQENYMGHDVNTVPPAGTPSPSPLIHIMDEEQTKRLQEELEKKTRRLPEPVINIPVPTPIRRPDQ